MTHHVQNIANRRFAGTRYTCAMGPVDIPGGAEFVTQRLDSIARQGACTRVGLVPDTDSRSWLLDPSRGISVRQLSTSPSSDVGRCIRYAADTATAPLDVLVIGDHMYVTIDHGLGDGVFATEMLAALGQPSERKFPSYLEPSDTVTSHASRTALAHVLRSDARAFARATAGLLTGQSRPGMHPESTPVTDPAIRCVVAESAPDFPSRLRRIRDALSPGASAVATLGWLIHERLRENGVRTAASCTYLVNLRRFLPPGTACTANFVGLINTPTSSLDAMNAAMRDRLNGPGLAIHQAVSDALAFAQRSRLRMPNATFRVETDELHVFLSDLTSSTVTDDICWSDHEHRRPVLAIAPNCTHSNTLNLAFTRARDRVFVTGSFFDDTWDAGTIQSALTAALSATEADIGT